VFLFVYAIPAGHAMIAPHGCISMNKLPMTTVGHLALENELTRRIRVERPRLIQRIQEAIADDTNLAENSEYQAAKSEQERNEARMASLRISLRGPTLSMSPNFLATPSNLEPQSR
jgi:hypothetical protein